MSVKFVLEAIVVLGAIVMGTRSGGVGVGLWGGLGTAVLVFVFREAPGAPPASAMAIILAVVTTAALMQAAGGVDWMVAMAARVIEKRPAQITFIAPLTAFVFSIGAGTSNIIYPLLPVIYDVSYRNKIRPSRPLTVTVVQSGIALAASPVSAAMAAMLTLTDVKPYNLGLTEILSITIPACVVAIVVTSFVVNRMGKELEEDPEVKARIAAGTLTAPGAVAPVAALTAADVVTEAGASAATSAPVAAVGAGPGSTGTAGDGGASPAEPGTPTVPPTGNGNGVPLSASLTFTKEGRNSALTFFAGVIVIVILGLFPELRPAFKVPGEGRVPIDMTTTIVLVMFTAAVVILFVGKPTVGDVPDQSVFKAGMVSAIALFGIAWMTATFIAAHETYLVNTIGNWVNNYVFLFALAVFLVAALTTSQSTATRTIVPIGLAAGLAPGLATGMWAGGLGGVYVLPANGTQIAAANFDLSGTTKLGTKLFDHSFFIPNLILSVTAIAVGAAIGGIFY
jgi:anaerobic C4-dicarboxylate transporter DcuB